RDAAAARVGSVAAGDQEAAVLKRDRRGPGTRRRHLARQGPRAGRHLTDYSFDQERATEERKNRQNRNCQPRRSRALHVYPPSRTAPARSRTGPRPAKLEIFVRCNDLSATE